jgi:hypothetical protein
MVHVVFDEFYGAISWFVVAQHPRFDDFGFADLSFVFSQYSYQHLFSVVVKLFQLICVGLTKLRE